MDKKRHKVSRPDLLRRDDGNVKGSPVVFLVEQAIGRAGFVY